MSWYIYGSDCVKKKKNIHNEMFEVRTAYRSNYGYLHLQTQYITPISYKNNDSWMTMP